MSSSSIASVRSTNRIQPAGLSGTVSPRAAASRRAVYFASLRSVFAVEADAIKFQTVIDEAIAELGGDLLLQRFDFRIDELDHLARLDIDQMIVMRFGRRFVACAPIAEVVPVEDAGLFEQTHGAVDRGDGNTRVDLVRAFVQQLDIG